ncbi:MAG: hypothetical protein IKL10_04805 [Clostridia bacterium]|nr:hypothetical protein [Clostridia bacterium]
MREYIYRYPGISSERYKELLAFCKQIEDYKRELKNCYIYPPITASDMPRQNEVSAPTEKRAIKAGKYREYIEMIESSANEASNNNSSISAALIQNICYGVRYEYLDCFLSRNSFYKTRRKFFSILSEKK